MVKTYLKTLIRVFKKHFTRLLSVILMVVISVGFVAGIGCVVDKINDSMTDYYAARNVSDFIVKSKKASGFSDEDLDSFRARYGEENVNTGASLDVTLSVNGEERLVRLYFFKGEETLNVRESKEVWNGETPAYAAQSEQSDNKIKELPLGTEIELNFKSILKDLASQNGSEADPALDMLPDNLVTRTVTVTETVLSPLTFAVDGEPSFQNPEDVEIPDNISDVNKLITVENILYLSYDVVPEFYGNKLLPVGDAYIATADRDLFSGFSTAYKNYVDDEISALSALAGAEDVKILTLYDNYSFHSLHSYAEKVRAICYVLMVAFMLVTALVVLSTMTRLIEEERAQVACLSTLGYPAWRIVFKYLLFAMIGCGIGGVGAYFVELGIMRLLYVVFHYSFAMPPMTARVNGWFFVLVYCFITVSTLAATALAGRKMTGEKPAVLLRPKAPKVGKKVFLERIPFIWNMLSFKYKSTMRNVLRYMNRFLMTVIAVAFSTALVMAGLALLDLCLFHGIDSPTVMAVAVVVVIFAGLLTAVVVYTLTNINISERNRELATLMVLGYFDKEVAGYIYREIYIDTAVGIAFGYPCSALLIHLVFGAMGMGTLGGVSWFVWLIAPFIVLAFTAVVTLFLRRKIVKIDMNESLKAIE